MTSTAVKSLKGAIDKYVATPVPADGELFVRTRSALYSFGVSQ